METIDALNQRLVDYYGIDTVIGLALFRIVWADTETEMRLVEHSLSGVEYIHPVVQEVPKYPYLRELYVLERLSIVPEVNERDIPSTKLSYEPIWAYCDNNRGYVYPLWDATKFIVDCLYASMGKKSMANYVDDEKNTTKEGVEQRVLELQEELFGNETETCDALRYKEGIVVPQNYEKKES